MPGRIKHKPSAPTPIIRKLTARMAQAPAPTGGPILDPANNDASLVLNKASIVWLVILSLIVVGTFAVICWLLCRCRRRKTRRRHSNGRMHHPSLEITDGRNQFQAWNRSVPLPPVFKSDQTGLRLLPLSHARLGGDIHPGEPVIVDEAPLSPALKREGGYYSGMQNVWKRASQIGKAY